MSMLAEQKRKVRWSLNPRGNLWAKDEAKFGQKLLEKMGWRKGKGLGKLENGNVDHIKVMYKNDNNGFGWDEKVNGWVTHQNHFDSLLANLNNSYPDRGCTNEQSIQRTTSSCGISLEERAKSFKGRMHYKKFLQAKDVSQYSKKDIESIFGKKLDVHENDGMTSESATIDQGSETESTINASVESEKDYSNYSGVLTVQSSTSVADYFSEKMKSMKLKQNVKSFNESNEISIPVEVGDVSSIELPFQEKTIPQKKKNKRKLEQTDKSSASENSAYFHQKRSRTDHCSLKTVIKVEKDQDDIVCNTTLKSCLKSEKNAYDVEKKAVKFSKKLAQVQIFSLPTLSPEKNENSLKDDLPGENVSTTQAKSTVIYPVNNEITEKPETNGEVATKPNELNSNDLWIHKHNVLQQFPITESMFGNNNDSWRASIKLAEKMSCYYSINKSIQFHEILSTTNLIDIKGYGN